MKKRILLILTLVVGLFIFNYNVKADEEKNVRLDCAYKHNLDYFRITIFEDDTWKIYETQKTDFDIGKWHEIKIEDEKKEEKKEFTWMQFGVEWETDMKTRFEGTGHVDELEGLFKLENDGESFAYWREGMTDQNGNDLSQYSISHVKSCYPKLLRIGNENKDLLDYYFFHNITDTDLSEDTTHFKLVDYERTTFNYDFGDTTSILGDIITATSSDNIREEIGNPWKKKWDVRCVYEDFDVFFNDEKLLFRVKSRPRVLKVLEFALDYDEFINENGGQCPEKFYLYNTAISTHRVYLNEKDISLSDCIESPLWRAYYASYDSGGEIDSCRDLIGENVYEKINEYFSIVRIVIPILLIGFGIFDFVKAVFGNDENMKKAKTTFIMRIVAAILFFLLPLFLKFILDIANAVWDFINPETCIK